MYRRSLNPNIPTTHLQEQACEGNYSSLHRIAQALLQLQAAYGAAREVRGKGAAALQLQRLLSRCHTDNNKT